MHSSQQFKKQEDGTILDTKTGLIWQAEHVGPMPWQKAKEYAKNLKLGGCEDWRLPTIEELITLIDPTRESPASAFPNAISYGFWSSLPYLSDTSYAAYVSFYTGSVLFNNKTYDCYVRCVRSTINITDNGKQE